MIDLTVHPQVSNLSLQGPQHIKTFEEFCALPVSDDDMQRREMIYVVQGMCERADVPIKLWGNELAPIHSFSDGVYRRELTMPAGFIIVGKRHSMEHLVHMTKGFCTCFTERGYEDMAGDVKFWSPAGEKRLLFIHEETTWVTYHKTDATTVEEVESEISIVEPLLIPVNMMERLLERNKQ
jgi:hypothetical protein